MTGLGALIRRNSKLYFKDKGMFFTSLITPMILLVLYVTFLSRTYEGSFRSALAAAGAQVEDSLLHGCVGGQLISSLLAVSCVTVAFCSNLTMVFDKVSGARNDLTVSPVRPAVLSLSYYLATFCTTLLINGIAAAACFGYLALTGWYLSAADVLLVLLDVVLLVLDMSRPLSAEDESLLRTLHGRNGCIVLNKSDLPPVLTESKLQDAADGKPILTDVDIDRPVSIAAHEIAEDLITYRRNDDDL